MSEDGFSTAADFRAAQRAEMEEKIAWGEVQRLTLPKKGLVVGLRHPGPPAALTFLRLHARLWEAVVQESEQNKAKALAERSFAASIEYQDLVDGMLARIFVHPAYGTLPGQIGFGDILVPDLNYILRWLGGEIVVAASGATDDLAGFPGGSGAASVPEPGSMAQPLPAK